jgi:hypothetical protein
MMIVRRLSFLIVLFLPGVFLISFAIAPLLNGVAVDSAIPIPIYLVRQTPLPQSTYKTAAAKLFATYPGDGGSRIFASEAAMSAGAARTSQIAPLVDAISHTPANARGWMILSDAYAAKNPAQAADALGQSMLLAPYDYWLAGPRSVRAAKLWARLNADDRANALRQVVLLWEEPVLRPQIDGLLQTDRGVAIVNRAFGGQPDELRDLNRWLSQQHRRYRDGP